MNPITLSPTRNNSQQQPKITISLMPANGLLTRTIEFFDQKIGREIRSQHQIITDQQFCNTQLGTGVTLIAIKYYHFRNNLLEEQGYVAQRTLQARHEVCVLKLEKVDLCMGIGLGALKVFLLLVDRNNCRDYFLIDAVSYQCHYTIAFLKRIRFIDPRRDPILEAQYPFMQKAYHIVTIFEEYAGAIAYSVYLLNRIVPLVLPNKMEDDAEQVAIKMSNNAFYTHCVVMAVIYGPSTVRTLGKIAARAFNYLKLRSSAWVISALG